MKKNRLLLSKELVSWLSLICLLILFAGIRYRLLDVPLERDEGEYAYAGQLILEGVFPYQEVFNMKLPGIYAAYALLLSIFGHTHHGIHLGLLFVNSLTIVFVFLLARKITGAIGAIMAAACFALLSVTPAVDGIYANAEHFVIFFATAGLLTMLNALASKNPIKLFAAGILLGLCFLMKQHGVAFVIFAFCFIGFDVVQQSRFQWKHLLLNLISFSGGPFLVFGFVCLILFWGGVFKSFWFWTVDYALSYISIVTIQDAWYYFLSNAVPIIFSAPLLWFLIACGLIVLVVKKSDFYNRFFLFLFILFSFLSLCPGLYFRSHYFVLMLPCVSLLAGVSLSFLRDILKDNFTFNRSHCIIPVFIILISLFHSLWLHRGFLFHMTPFQISRMIYGTNPFPESIVVADFIKKNTTNRDCVAILGSEPQIFFYSQRRSASGYIYMYQMMENHPFALDMQKEFIKDIETKQPKYILFIKVSTSWLRQKKSELTMLHWLRNRISNKQLQMVGSVEIFFDKSVFQWNNNAKQPKSPFSILIYENTNPDTKL